MDENSSRALEDLRALVASCTPMQVFGALTFLWTEAAARADAPAEDAELWELAAEAAREAATSLTLEETDAPDGAESGDEADEAAAPESAPDAAHETESEALDTAPAPSAPPALETATATQTIDEDTTMARDARLGQLPQGATWWRAKRVDGQRRKGEALFWDNNGVAVEEWPVRSLSARTILDRWGPGSYVIQYIAEENGRRRPCGTSRILQITGQKDGPAQVAAPLSTMAPSPAAPAPVPSPSYIASMMPAPGGSGAPPLAGGDPMFANVFALMTYMNDQNERARAQAAAEARIAADRYRAELDAQLERERIASQERVALAQAQGQFQAKAVRAAGPFDADALAAKIGEVVGAKLQEALEDETADDDDEGPAPPVIVQAPAAPADNTAKIIDALKETLGPLITMFATHMQTQAQSPAPRGQVIDHAAE